MFCRFTVGADVPRARYGRSPILTILLVAMPLMAAGHAAAGLFEPAMKWLRRALAKGGRYHHVFHGEVRLKKGAWQGSGWHHRFMGQDPVDRRVTRIVGSGSNGTYAAEVEMRAPNGQWVGKKAGSSFFPDNWTPKQVSDTIHDAFANSRTVPGTGGRRWEGLSNGIPVQGSYNQTGKNWNSAWPII
jgi:hypothetical protein